MFELIKHAIEYFAGIDNGLAISYNFSKYNSYNKKGEEVEVTYFYVGYTQFELNHWSERDRLKWEFFVNWLDNYSDLHGDGDWFPPFGRVYEFDKENFHLEISREW